MNNFYSNYGLVILSLIITLIAQAYVSHNYNKYSKIKNKKNITGESIARFILDKNNLNNIAVRKTNGYLTDHYDPRNKLIKLSEHIHSDFSIASIAVAAHECGHAIQDKDKYLFMRFRSFIVPFVNFSSYAGYFAIIFGIIFKSLNLIKIGILAELIILLFQIVTLPVEFNASKRAIKELESLMVFDRQELKQSKRVLVSAALTYVASVATTLIQILRLILLFNRRD